MTWHGMWKVTCIGSDAQGVQAPLECRSHFGTRHMIWNVPQLWSRSPKKQTKMYPIGSRKLQQKQLK